MISRVRWASIAVAILVAAPACWAQTSDSAAVSPAAPRSGMLPGRGSIGGQIGGSYFFAGKDYALAAQPRLSFAGHFRYVVSPRLRWQLTPYYTWTAYRNDEPVPFRDPQFPADATKDRYLTQLAGANAQIQWLRESGRWKWHLGAGPALYRVWVENRRKVLKDPQTFRLHRGLYWGGSGEIGVERFLKVLPNTSLELTLAGHMAFAERKDQFPSGFNGSPSALELRLGGHYYYDFNRGKKPDTLPGLRKR